MATIDSKCLDFSNVIFVRMLVALQNPSTSSVPKGKTLGTYDLGNLLSIQLPDSSNINEEIPRFAGKLVDFHSTLHLDQCQ